MASPQIKSIIESMLQPYMAEHGFELVDIEYIKEGSNWFLRIYADKENGIDIEDCGKISEYLGKLLDEQNPIATAYFLEVSSPGAERALTKPDDYRKSVGKRVFVTTFEPFDGLKEFEGKLLSYDEQMLLIQTGKKKVHLPCTQIASARLAIVF